MPVPQELLVLLALLVVGTGLLIWAVRQDWLVERRLDLWRFVEIALSQFFLLAMLLSCSLQVVVRYLFADQIVLPWTEELARLAMVWAALWGAAALHHSDEHIRLTLLYDLLGPRGKAVLEIVGHLAVIAVFVPIVWYGWKSAQGLNDMSTVALGLPLSVFAYVIPVTGGVILLHSLAQLAGRLRVHLLRSELKPGI